MASATDEEQKVDADIARISAFLEVTQFTPTAFIEAWKVGFIEDNHQTAELLAEALLLRRSLETAADDRRELEPKLDSEVEIGPRGALPSAPRSPRWFRSRGDAN